MHIRSPQQIHAFTSAHGEIVRELLGAAAGGASQHSVAHITLPPGAASLKHYHPTAEESYTILAGEGRLTLGGETVTLAPDDSVAIPAGVVHQIANAGSVDLVFLAVCVPPWTPDCSVFVD
jgi:mannose-6-phosphate isomerase-like protein (cupin superfamily)